MKFQAHLLLSVFGDSVLKVVLLLKLPLFLTKTLNFSKLPSVKVPLLLLVSGWQNWMANISNGLLRSWNQFSSPFEKIWKVLEINFLSFLFLQNFFISSHSQSLILAKWKKLFIFYSRNHKNQFLWKLIPRKIYSFKE